MKAFYEKKRNHDLYLRITRSLSLDAHMHESVEIIYLMEGTICAFSGGESCQLYKGDFFVAFPNTVHYYNKCSNNLAILAIIPLSILPEFRNILTTKSLRSPLVRDVDPQASELLKKLMNYNGKYKNEVVRGMLLAMFSMIMEKAVLLDETISSQTTLGAILEFCENNYKEEISLRMVSENLSISQSHISHIFSNVIHMNFRNYINSLRLNTSLQLLKQGELNITEIASESGFESIRTFNRTFRKKFGISPREYIRQSFQY